ncbi:hypothetical protein [Streptomyces sp. AM 2-1-1]|uniref:hypothetical protein n=1 Tax=Streptomyces sp. AM 2-1-1 TaxID=3028709 RepID=UPI0023B9AD67|nr:hypothetical protein [Streptomyces sp. AM 2-1-1]WEH40776.1 hypothetical protein PZB77_15400 [Streptomyces sp. AM 2-1-1]
MTTEPVAAQQQLPGVKYRPEARTRLVPHTLNGRTRMVKEAYVVQVPVPPRDWDHIVTTGALAASLVLLAVALVWSTASIGDYLARAITAPIAYLCASACALGWMICMALEWLARYDAARAAGPRAAGTVFLLLDMAAVAAHGWTEDSLYVGLAGAAVSAVAKKMFSVVMEHQARPLPDRTRAWLLEEEAEISAALALSARTRHLARIQAQATAYAPALPPADTTQDTDLDTPGQLSPTVRSAVRAIRSTVPDLSPDDVLEHLDTLGLDYDEDVVRVVLDNQDNPQDRRDTRSTGPLPSIAPPGQTVTDSIRTALSSGVQDKDSVLSYVKRLHPTAADPSIVRILNRELEKTG